MCTAIETRDISVPIRALGVRARCLTSRGELRKAEELAREALKLAAATDFLNDHAEAWMTLAEVLNEAERAAASCAAAHRAIDLWERKGNSLAAGSALRMPSLKLGVSNSDDRLKRFGVLDG
jgi:tetratricopeptide (TPR) repeat protein